MDAAESKGFVHHGTPVVCKPSFKVLYGMIVAGRHALSLVDQHAEQSNVTLSMAMFIGN